MRHLQSVMKMTDVTQFGPPDQVVPGYAGFPRGFNVDGRGPLISYSVAEYESPLSSAFYKKAVDTI
jgi:hypothetical protein